jgi:hypothetical protein
LERVGDTGAVSVGAVLLVVVGGAGFEGLMTFFGDDTVDEIAFDVGFRVTLEFLVTRFAALAAEDKVGATKEGAPMVLLRARTAGRAPASELP